MPEAMSELYQIQLDLQIDWSKKLAKQSNAFENFIDKAQTSARRLEKSVTSMQGTVLKQYDGLFAGSQKQMDKLTQFAKGSLTSISTSATKILEESRKRQDQHVKYVEKNIKRIQQLEQKAGLLKTKMAPYEKDSKRDAQYEALAQARQKALEGAESIKDVMGRVGQHHTREVSRLMAQHFAIVSKGVLDKSKAVSKATDLLIDNTIKKFNILKSQTGLMGKIGGAEQLAGGVKGMEAQQKNVFANLKQLGEAHATAQMAYQDQIKLRDKSTNEEIRKWHTQTLRVIEGNMEKIKGEYLDTAKKARVLTTEIRKQKSELTKKGTSMYEGMRKELAPSRIKGLFSNIFANVQESASLAGRGMMKALMSSVERGDELNQKLGKFKDRLVEIKQEAKRLSDAGLIDPKKIKPKIDAAENLIKGFEQKLRHLKSDMAKFAPKGMKEFRVFELGDVSKTRDQINSLTKTMAKAGTITSKTFENMHKDYTRINNLVQENTKARRTAAKKIESIEREATRVSKQIANVRDAEIRKQMAAYVARMRKHAENLRKVLERPTHYSKQGLKGYQDQFEHSVRQTIKRVEAIVKNSDMVPKKQFQELKTEYASTIKLIEKVAKKRFFRTESIAEAKVQVKGLSDKVRSYKDLIKKLEEELKKLQMMQRRGFRNQGIRKSTQDLKENIQGMKRYVSEVNSMHGHAVRRMRDTAKMSTKGMLRSGWEMIRNFRWQVAAIIYLITRAVQAVKRVFTDTMGEIAKFRRDAMALAAQYSFKMFGDMKENFQQAYQFSRNLMQKLEVIAAETILTLDDMLMLTKTFAQAGIIPRTDEDLNRIATIGTAIKALTEGMANAGVQMKQELYAIIAGRQRATDQLAMMFKLMGKDIQAMIDQGKMKGKQMIEVLADALKPFSVMNEALKDEWEAVINKLKIVWKIIKRLGLETHLLESTKAIKDFIESFWNKAEGLTQRGREAAAALQMGFYMVKNLVAIIWETVGSILHRLGDIVSLTLTMVGATSAVSQGTSQVSTNMMSILTISEGLLKVFWLLNGTVRAISTTVNLILSTIVYIIDAVKSLGSYLGGYMLSVLSIIPGKIGDAAKEASKIQLERGANLINNAYSRLSKATADFTGQVKKNEDELKEIDNMMKKILETMEKLKTKGAELGQEFKLTYPTGIFDEWFKMTGEMQRAEAAQYKGPKRYEIELKHKVEALETLKMKTKQNLLDFAEMQTAYNNKTLEMTEKQFEDFKNKRQAHKQILLEVHTYESWLNAEAARKTNEWNKKEEIALARRQRKYSQFMREALQVPLSPKEKAADWVEKMKIDLKELAISSDEFAKHYDEVLAAIERGGEIRETNALKQMNLEAEKFINKASKANAWNNVYDELNIEFAEYVRQIEKSKTLEKEKKPELIAQLNVIKAQRKAQEQMNLVHQSYLAQLDVQLKKANYLKGSFSPIKQREGEIMALQASHNKAMADMQKKLDEFNLTWKDNGQWVKDADDNVKAIGASYEETMRQMTIATQRELQKKQMPIWNDLVEASKGWADGFTDALSNIVDGIGSVQEALNALQQQIIKDVLKTVIKRTITDNLMDALGSGSESPMAGFFGMFPTGGKGKGEAQEITATKPIPVTVFNTGELMKDTFKVIEPMEKLPLPEEAVGQRVFITNWPMSFGGGEGAGIFGGTGEIAEEGVQGVSQDLADISGEIAENTAAAEQSTKSWYSGITDVFSNIGSWISGLFSGGAGAGAGGGGGTQWAGLAMQGASMMMADGGRISEPIVGKGLQSGEIYNFGERTKYGEDEIVAPMKKMQRNAPSQKIEHHMPIHINAIDTQSGVQFLMKHSDTIQGQMVKNLKKNKPIRKGIQNAY